MKSYVLLFVFFVSLVSLNAQIQEQYSSVRISLQGKVMEDLMSTGIETDHGEYYPGRSLTVVLSTSELQRVQSAGFQTEILIADLMQYYQQQCSHPQPVEQRNGDCDATASPLPNYTTPVNYSYGTMGGYLTYAQMMAELDKMRALYPQLITARTNVSDTIVTWEGRPVYQVKISDNPDQDEAERELLYTALHHAREPNSASQLIFFMWYLLENYATRPDIQAVVDNLELYFVPCINVDGYIFNETTYPAGGGQWRKNRRDNGNGKFGVDLNRNYGYFWGDFGGSSADPVAETYRGPAAFSEPESRMMRDFCLAHDFLFACNAHTSGNYFIYPWSYNDQLADSAFFRYGQLFTRESHFRFGTASQTVGYQVNGCSDDWMYQEKGTYSFTPEIGATGFWPMPGQIDELNKSTLWQNLSMAYSALRYGEAKDLEQGKIYGFSGDIPIEFARFGLMEGGIQVSLLPFSSNITSPATSYIFEQGNLEKAIHLFPFQLDGSLQEEEAVVFLLKTDNGFWTKTDTLRKVFHRLSPVANQVFQDKVDDNSRWTGDWLLTNETFHSATSCMTDSPDGPYGPDQVSTCTLLEPVAFPPNALSATLRFFAKWDLEEDWDYTQVAALGSDGVAVPLCGLYTETGKNVQPSTQVFDGQQLEWVEECMDLSDFIGQAVQIQFLLVSDGFQQADGYYFDDVRIEYILPGSGTHSMPVSGFRLAQNEPNPASTQTVIHWESTALESSEDAKMLVFNVLGELVLQVPIPANHEKKVVLDTQTLAPGVYTYVFSSALGQSLPLKMLVAR